MAAFESTNLKETFSLSGGREMVDASRASVLLSEVATTVKTPTALKLSNKSFSFEAASLIASFIRSLDLSKLLIADMSDIIAGRPEEEALKVLAVISNSLSSCSLEELNLSDNALGAKGLNACKAVLIGKYLQRLYLCNNGLSGESCKLVATILAENGGYPPLRVLHFYNNMSGDVGGLAVADMIKMCPFLTDFRFSATRSQNQGCLAIAESLCSVSGLIKLDMSDTTCGLAAAKVIAGALKQNTLMTHLNLRDASLTEVGALAILRALVEANAPIEILDLSGNDLTEDSANEIADILSLMTSLCQLYLDDNEFGTDGIVKIFNRLKSKSNSCLAGLKILSICTCDITARGAYHVARYLSDKKLFRTLMIDGNQIVEQGLEMIKSLFLRNGKFIKEFEDNDEDGDDDIEEAIEELGAEDSQGVSDGEYVEGDADIELNLLKALADVKI